MSVGTGTTCHYLRALGVSGVPNNPTSGSVFCWAKSTADNSAYRAIFHADSADGATPSDTGFQFTTTGSDGIAFRVARGGTEEINGSDTDPGVYWWQGANRNTWKPMSGYFDGSATTLDAAAYWGTTGNVAEKDITGGNINGLCDDFYVLRRDSALWAGDSDNSQANLRIAHLAVWFNYRLTTGDIADLTSGVNPMDIGGGPDYYWPFVTEAGDGLVDDVAGVTLSAQGGSAAATWYDSDNPSVDAPSGGGDTTAPVITGPGGATGSTSTVNVNENTIAVHTFTANEAVTWDLNGGADVSFFTINSSTGALSFSSAPDYENPLDSGSNNSYVVGVRATDGASNATTQTCTVSVVNVSDTAPAAPSIGTTTSITHTTATIPWTDNSSDEASFLVQIETPSGANNWADASTGASNPTAANATSLAITGLTNGTQYRARVRASNGSGDSSWSTGSAFTTTANGVLTLTDFANNAAGAQASISGVKFAVFDASGNHVVTKSANIDSGADVSINDALFAIGTAYHGYAFDPTAGSGRIQGVFKATAT